MTVNPRQTGKILKRYFSILHSERFKAHYMPENWKKMNLNYWWKNWWNHKRKWQSLIIPICQNCYLKKDCWSVKSNSKMTSTGRINMKLVIDKYNKSIHKKDVYVWNKSLMWKYSKLNRYIYNIQIQDSNWKCMNLNSKLLISIYFHFFKMQFMFDLSCFIA